MRKTLIALAVVALLVVSASVTTYRWINDRGSSDGNRVTVTIPPGSSGQQIAIALKRKGVIDSALAFRIYLKLHGIDSQLRAGKYELRTSTAFARLVIELKKGPKITFVKLVIPEGFNIEQTARQVGRVTHIKEADFLAAVSEVTVRPVVLPAGQASLEGFLFPATYFVERKETATSLVRRLVSEFERKTAPFGLSKAKALGRTPYEAIIIASMVEEEAKVDEDRPKIAAVIYNRLKKGIPLGIDATIQYAVKKYSGQPLTQSDLQIDSPYNTRIVPGLPPTPISSPGFESIRAALNPDDSNILYFVLDVDCKHHVFTVDYSQFVKAKQRQPTNC